MTVDQLISHYKTQTRAAKACNVSQSAVSNWKARGRIPDLQQVRIEARTKKKLRADPGIIH